MSGAGSLHWMRKGMVALLLGSFAAGLPMSGRLVHALAFSVIALLATLASVATDGFLGPRARKEACLSAALLASAAATTILLLLLGIAFPALAAEAGPLIALAAIAPFAHLIPPAEGRPRMLSTRFAGAMSASSLACLGLCALAALRELLATGTVNFAGQDPLVKLSFSFGFVALGSGGLIVAGYLLAAARGGPGAKEKN